MLEVSLTKKDIIRIFSKIVVDKKTGCWNWTGTRTSDGYGKIYLNKKTLFIHRVIYSWLIKPIPNGRGKQVLNLDHYICNNPSCCNPEHLKLVLPKDNIHRSNCVSAVNARKTRCIRGHFLPLTPNRKDRKGRMCKFCRNITQRARRTQSKSRSL